MNSTTNAVKNGTVNKPKAVKSTKSNTKTSTPKSGKGKATKTNTTKNPNKPKKAMTGWILYSTTVRPQFKEAYPDKSFGEITKLVSERWQSLSDQEKAQWSERAASIAVSSAHKPDNPTKLSKPVKTDKPAKHAKDANMPKKPLTAWVFYSTAMRPAYKERYPNESFGGLTKLISEQWKTLSDDEKRVWNEKSAADKIRYENEMEIYNRNIQ